MASLSPSLLVRPEDIPQEIALPSPLHTREYLFDGELRVWDGPTQEVLSPLSTSGPAGPERIVLGSCPVHDAVAGMAALHAACAAWDNGLGQWPNLDVEARMACVEDFCRRMRSRRAEIVRLMVWEICKPTKESEQEFDRTIEYIEATLAAMREMAAEAGRVIAASGLRALCGRSARGVTLCLGPFNFPLNETLATLIPALLMGNTAVVKLPRIGRLLFTPLLDCFHKAFPRGVVNSVSGGVEAVTPMMRSGLVDVLAFIGSSKSAEALRALHPRPTRLHCVFGLEAKNAAIILPDADLDVTVAEVLRGAYGFNGQRCTALKLVLASRLVADAFLERLRASAEHLKIGLPWEPGVGITPLPEPGKPRFLESLRKDALSRGARELLPGAGMLDETLFAPSLLAPVTPDMRLYHEEQFGPVLPVGLFDDPEEALRAVAASNYGQQASLFGSDVQVLARLSGRLRNLVSRVNINCKCQRGPDELPFTARKDSAVGTLSVGEGLAAFSLPTLTVLRHSSADGGVLSALGAVAPNSSPPRS
ncbi:glyceraldehyde-3-phosphate dehydrogenase (NADP+) [Humidesulfovibrio mexicanus]|uniref:Glyceraldehyde-3-phosphate dehydrogenase (NADP+) n=2 Tax=Humidesulfovibrio mexicanus TaxID=147047 RepID=A0A238XK53_9BACT|nr:glyceraldehyde-3-phosphate dehydrogenase (NADP+) [Humidesulfovibrio mexicanus]